MDEQFEKIEELINDEDKIVTLASLTFQMQIPLEEAKKILNKYVEVNKKTGKIRTTYVLTGIKKETDVQTVALVEDNKLELEKSQFKNEPTVNLFSVQKAKSIDYNIMYLSNVNAEINNDVLPGTIIGRNCVKRVLRKKALPPLPTSGNVKSKSIFFKQNSSAKSDVKANTEEKVVPEHKNEPSSSSNKVKATSQGKLASMFDKVSQNAKASPKQPSTEPKLKQAGALPSLFSKQPIKKAAPSKEADEVKEPNIAKPNEEAPNKNRVCLKEEVSLFDSDTDEDILRDLDLPAKEKESLKEKKAEAPQKKKRGKSDVGNNKSAKRRKRIVVEDSDSDDIFGSDHSEDKSIELFSEEPDMEKTESKPSQPKNKRRKAVKKTYEDDEGFIVTQTEFVYETASEDENEPANKIIRKAEEEKPASIKKNSNLEADPSKANKNKKLTKKASSGSQPTLMDFFKKK